MQRYLTALGIAAVAIWLCVGLLAANDQGPTIGPAQPNLVSCEQNCERTCRLRWLLLPGHAGDRYARYQAYLKCAASCKAGC